MPNFDKYVARHGEIGVQAIIEGWERCEGIRDNAEVPLEDRWMAFIHNTNAVIYNQNLMAA